MPDQEKYTTRMFSAPDSAVWLSGAAVGSLPDDAAGAGEAADSLFPAGVCPQPARENSRAPANRRLLIFLNIVVSPLSFQISL
nr:hypothetical protein [Anaerofilum sp. An201]